MYKAVVKAKSSMRYALNTILKGLMNERNKNNKEILRDSQKVKILLSIVYRLYKILKHIRNEVNTKER